MNTLHMYMAVAIVSLGVFYSAFTVFLRSEPLFRFNRTFLLLSVLISQFIPLIIFLPSPAFINLMTPQGSSLLATFNLKQVEIVAQADRLPSASSIISYVYITGILLFALRFIIRLHSIHLIAQKGVRSAENLNNIVWTDAHIPPFSFLRSIYLPSSLKGSMHLGEVLKHENVHISEWHSLDILFIQALQIICWINPFIPLIEKRLREVHEFEADKSVLESGLDIETYTQILFAQDKTAQAVVLGNKFNYSLIKRRLTMLYKQTTRYARLKAFVVMPLSVTIAIFFAINCNQSAIAQNKSGTTDVQTVPANTPNVPPVEQSKPASKPQDAKVVNGNPPSIPVPPPPPPPPPPLTNKKEA